MVISRGLLTRRRVCSARTTCVAISGWAGNGNEIMMLVLMLDEARLWDLMRICVLEFRRMMEDER